MTVSKGNAEQPSAQTPKGPASPNRLETVVQARQEPGVQNRSQSGPPQNRPHRVSRASRASGPAAPRDLLRVMPSWQVPEAEVLAATSATQRGAQARRQGAQSAKSQSAESSS